MQRAFTAVVFLVFILGISPSAIAQAMWTCTSPGFGPGAKSVTRRFTIVGAELIRDDVYPEFPQRHVYENYKILQNNEYGIVAVWSTSRSNQPLGYSYVGAETIIIDKKTDEFWYGKVSNHQVPNLAPSVGSCIPN